MRFAIRIHGYIRLDEKSILPDFEKQHGRPPSKEEVVSALKRVPEEYHSMADFIRDWNLEDDMSIDFVDEDEYRSVRLWVRYGR